MKPAVLRLILSGLLFFGWIGWLIYLTTTLQEAVVLSRPQLLRADLDVIARVEEGADGAPRATITIEDVPWAQDARDKALKKIKVENLAELFSERDTDSVRPIKGWEGPGLYILPLVRKQRDGSVAYRVADIPRSPGYPRDRTVGPPRIYRATDDARRQLANIRNGDWE